MSDKDENREENAVVAIIIGFAVVLAIAVSFWAAFGAISLSGKPATASAAASGGGSTSAAATTPAAASASAAPAASSATDTAAAAAAPAASTDASAGTTSATAAAAASAVANGAAANGAAASPVAGPVKLYFDTGRNDLPATASADLAPIVEAIKAGRASRAVVSGFHDKTGPANVNAEVSKARALAVAAALRAAGLTDAQIDLRKPQETTGDGNNREARRVEVTAEKG